MVERVTGEGKKARGHMTASCRDIVIEHDHSNVSIFLQFNRVIKKKSTQLYTKM
jgi:hypothetical protein